MADLKSVWLEDDERGFIKAELIDTNELSTVRLPSGETTKVPFTELVRVNPEQFDRASDIAELTYLNEPSVLHNLECRYSHNEIYTYSGLFLVAINPYKTLPIYDLKNISKYQSSSRDGSTPHIYSVAHLAFQQMLDTGRDQSVLVTGESGAGKTENTKRVIQYLSSVKHVSHHNTAGHTIDEKIVQTNPILESFGNAKTIRNNNSSRFGKFIQLEFSPGGLICGATVKWYLLEKSRVVKPSHGERNYHIFYQLIKGASEEMKQRLLLDSATSSSEFAYLARSDPAIPGVNDAKDFQDLIEAFDTIGISPEVVENILGVVASILHIGNIKLTQSSNEQGRIADTDALQKAAQLLGVSSSDLSSALLNPKVKAGREFITQSKTAAQAQAILDALSKSMYERLFDFLVRQLNLGLASPQAAQQNSSYIGVLDIAGFEIFETNSFEQLCINYTNEKLQQFFNHHMFVLEQQEYVREEIEWDYIDFGKDLQPTIDLIEQSKPMGILSCLDEDSLMPKTTDKSFTDKLIERWNNKSTKFQPSRAIQGFIVTHYAAAVEYDTEGWLEKNKDPISEPISSLLAKSNNSLVKTLFVNDDSEAADSPKARRGMVGTVVQKYKKQLSQLMEQLESTSPHFVRCILPNEYKKPDTLDWRLVLHQLRCNGVLEGIRLARSGYPNRVELADFRQRYTILGPEGTYLIPSTEDRKACITILEHSRLNTDGFKIGTSKLFFRNGVLAELEELRHQALEKIIKVFQPIARAMIVRTSVRRQLMRAEAAAVLAKAVKSFMGLKDDPWFQLLNRVKPLVSNGKSDSSARRDLRILRLEESLQELRKQLVQSHAETEQAGIKITELHNRLKTKETELEQLNNENLLSLQKMEHLQSHTQHIETMLSENEERVAELITSCELLSNTNEALTAKYDKAKSSYESLQNSSIDRSDYASISQECDQLRSKISYLENNLKEVKIASEAKEMDLRDAIEARRELEAELSVYQDQISTFQKEAKEYSSEKKALLAELETLKERLAESASQENQSAQVSEGLKASLDVLSAEVAHYKSLYNQAQSQITEVEASKEGAIASLEKKLKAQETDLQKSLSSSRTKERHADSLDEQIRVLEVKLTKEVEKTRKLMADLKDNKDRQRILEKQSSQVQCKLDDQIRIADFAKDEARKLKTALAEKTEIVESVNADIKRMRSSAFSLKESKSLKDTNAKLSDEVERLQASHADDQNRIYKLEQTIEELSKRQAEATATAQTSKEELLKLNSAHSMHLQESLPSDIAKITELTQSIADMKRQLLAKNNELIQSRESLQNYKSSNKDVVLLRALLDKVQHEKAQALEENSKLRFGLNDPRIAEVNKHLEQAQNNEIKKLSSQNQLLRIELVQTKKQLRQFEAQVSTEDVGSASALNAKCLELSRENIRLKKYLQEVQDSPAGLTIPRMRPAPRESTDSSPRLPAPPSALRTISGNDRQFSGSQSERNISRRLDSSGSKFGVSKFRDSSDLDQSLMEEVNRNHELNTMIIQLRKRVSDYQVEIDKAQILLVNASNSGEAAKDELQRSTAKFNRESTLYQSTIAKQHSLINGLKADLSNTSQKLAACEQDLAATRNLVEDKHEENEQLKKELVVLRETLNDIISERDRLSDEKRTLERRFSTLWSEENSPNGTRKVSGGRRSRLSLDSFRPGLQEKLEEALASSKRYSIQAAECQDQIDRNELDIQRLKEACANYEAQSSQYKSLYTQLEKRHNDALVQSKRHERDLQAAQETVLTLQRELEEHKLRYQKLAAHRMAASQGRTSNAIFT